MKTPVSLFLIVLSLLAEISAVAGSPWTEIEPIKVETAETSESSENLEPTLKLRVQIRRALPSKPHLLTLTYNTTEVLHVTGQSLARVYTLHQNKPFTSIVYLNNRVFVI